MESDRRAGRGSWARAGGTPRPVTSSASQKDERSHVRHRGHRATLVQNPSGGSHCPIGSCPQSKTFPPPAALYTPSGGPRLWNWQRFVSSSPCTFSSGLRKSFQIHAARISQGCRQRGSRWKVRAEDTCNSGSRLPVGERLSPEPLGY